MATYEEAVKVAKEFVGPAGQKFIDRQIKGIGISPADVTSANMEELAKRCLSSGAVLVGDDKAAEFSNKIKTLK